MTKGQIEDTIAKEITKFYVQHLGVGPKETRVYILKDMVIVRLKGKLMPIEQKLLQGQGGVGLVKNIRETLHEMMTDNLGELIKQVTKRTVISAHGDISTRTGERLDVYILDTDYEEELQKSDPR